MREVVTRMVEAGNTSLHDAYYDPDFLLTVNGRSQDLAAFRAEHDRVQRTGITFAVTYDEDSWVEGQDCLAGRIWITTHSACGRAARIEVLFVAAYRSGLAPPADGADPARSDPAGRPGHLIIRPLERQVTRSGQPTG